MFAPMLVDAEDKETGSSSKDQMVIIFRLPWVAELT